MKKLFQKIKSILPTKRKLIQLYCALLTNANVKGFFSGYMYTQGVKQACAPGLNCYSCPAASAACPLGSLQNAFYESGKRAPYYMVGIIILYGILFGRMICGYMCPFGLIQELIYKIKTPKLKKNAFTKVLSYLKYVILVFFVVIIPTLYGLRDLPLPAFCKYICPSGTLEGALGLLIHPLNEGMLGSLGPLFTWKFALMISFAVACVFIFRFFCRFFCPLGALYGLFNRFALLGIKLDKSKCTHCGLCISKCKVDIRRVGDHECVNCGECIDVCPTNAISWRGSKIILPPNEISAAKEKTVALANQKIDKENRKSAQQIEKDKKTFRFVLIQGILAAATLAATIYSAINGYTALIVLGSIALTVILFITGCYLGPVFKQKAKETRARELRLAELTKKTVKLTESEKTAVNKKAKRIKIRAIIIKVIAALLMVSVLIGALVYYNIIVKDPHTCHDGNGDNICDKCDKVLADEDGIVYGNAEGDNCFGYDIKVWDENGATGETFNPAKNHGKVTVINFWGVWCPGCLKELPYFNEVATEYKDQVTVLAIHTELLSDREADYIVKEFPDSDIIFGRDDADAAAGADAYYTMLGGTGAYPITLVLDENGVIVKKYMHEIGKAELVEAIELALATKE